MNRSTFARLALLFLVFEVVPAAGRPADPPPLPDVATVDEKEGGPGELRRLGVEPRTATSFEWQIVSRPGDSVAELSSRSVPDPTFVPDAIGVYRFRLLARTEEGVSTSDVEVIAACPSSLDHPGDRAACPGTATLFNATGTINSNAKWQWQKNQTNIGGAKSQSYTISSVATTDTALYDAVLTDSCGTTYSPEARLVVGSFPPPAIGGNVSAIQSGTNLVLHWTDVSNSLSYQVFEDSTASGGFTTVTGTATSGTAGLSVAIPSADRYYRVAGTNGCGGGAKGTCGTVTVTPATLPNAAIGIPYNRTVAQSGGTPPITYSVAAGTLPPGLSLNGGTGAITGTPTTLGSYPFGIRAADAGGCSGWAYYPVETTCPTMVVTEIPFAPLAGSGTVVPLGDEVLSAALPIGFTFSFYCNSYTQFRIFSEGYLTFASTAPAGVYGSYIPNTATPNNIVAMCWTDNDASVGGSISYFTTGSAPDRRLVVNFTNISNYNETATQTVQAILYETTNVIELHVSHVSYNSGLPIDKLTLGVENSDGTIGATPIGLNAQYTSVSSKGYRFTPGAD